MGQSSGGEVATQNITPQRSSMEIPLEQGPNGLLALAQNQLNNYAQYSNAGGGYNTLPNTQWGQIYVPGANQTVFGSNPFQGGNQMPQQVQAANQQMQQQTNPQQQNGQQIANNVNNPLASLLQLLMGGGQS